MLPSVTILEGDWINQLETLPEQSVHCCVTSPPYWGLRDYGTAQWKDGDPNCDHEASERYYTQRSASVSSSESFSEAGKVNANRVRKARWRESGHCLKCGSIKVDQQLGLEKTPEEYVAKIVEGFREVWRVLRDDGTLWMNLGDCYARQGGWSNNNGLDGVKNRQESDRPLSNIPNGGNSQKLAPGLKSKDLVGIPWRVAFALQADGWYLRSDIIWHKPNPMPESVTDRPTKAHEYIFLLSKQEHYCYDASSIAEPVLQSSLERAEAGVKFGGNNLCPDTRLQSGKLWLPKSEYKGKHSTTEANSAARRMLKSAKRNRENGGLHDSPFGATRNKRSVWQVPTSAYKDAHFATFPPDLIKPCIMAGCPASGTVLDPFGGAGTVGLVSLELGRNSILIELSPKYVELIKHRVNVSPGFPF